MRKADRGFTLIEIILVMSFMVIILPTVIVGLTSMVVQSNRAEAITIATDLARYYMEWTLSMRYDENVPELTDLPPYPLLDPTTFWSNPLGVDGAETAGNPSTFNDVDDWTTMTAFPIPGFTDYTLNVTVQYFADTLGADAGIWDTDVIPAAPPPTSNAKLITVTVSHTLTGNITLNCITGPIY